MEAVSCRSDWQGCAFGLAAGPDSLQGACRLPRGALPTVTAPTSTGESAVVQASRVSALVLLGHK